MCLYPKLMFNKKYRSTKKNKGVVPQAPDRRVLYVPVACGKCMECRKAKAREWQVRLAEEVRQDNSGVFVTMSFSDDSLYDIENGIGLDGVQYSQGIVGLEGYDLDNEIGTRAVRLFLERWRGKYKKSVKHWLVTELGQNSTERLHIHGLIWTDFEKKKKIDEVWGYGNVFLGSYVNEQTVNYIVKYISSVDEKHEEYMPKMLVSPGIGKGYLKRFDSKRNKYKKGETIEEYKTRTGIKLNMPIYYRNKLYSEDEREELWIDKLDKKVRWVDGKKIDVSTSDELYEKVLSEARRKNKRLGYGDDSINWDKKKYENDRRNLLKLERISKLDKKKG